MSFPPIPNASAAGQFTIPNGGVMPGLGNQMPPPSAPTPQAASQQRPLSTQVSLDKEELRRIRAFLDSQHQLAIDAHQKRITRCVMQEREWRKSVDEDSLPNESNFYLQLIQALMFSKHAREIEAIFGAKAGVTATPQGPSDAKMAGRVSLAMRWQLFENMDAMKALALCLFRRLKHGRSFCKIHYVQKFYNKRVAGQVQRVLYKSGPEIVPIDNEDIMLPADVEGFDSVQTARWVRVSYKTTPTEMLLHDSVPGQPAAEGDWYQGIAEKFERLVRLGRQGIHRDFRRDLAKIERDIDEGVQRDLSSGVREYLEIDEYYLRWRMPIQQSQPRELADDGDGVMIAKDDTDLNENESSGTPLSSDGFKDSDGVMRERIETDVLVRVVRDIGGADGIVGVQFLDELFPDTPIKRPIMEFAFLNDGHYWCMGLIELIKEIQREMNVLVNKLIEAVGLSIAPPVFYEPGAGDNFAQRKFQPFDMIPTVNAAGVKQMQIMPQTQAFTQLWLLFQSIYELLTGITNLSMGRGMDQPNAPRTLGGQRLVMGAADLRLALDMRMLNEDMRKLLNWVWDLWRMMGSEEEFFRVAEGDAGRGNFEQGELNNGFAKMSAKEREARYDFSFDFADDMSVREARKQEVIGVAQILAQLPVFMQNPQAQYRFAVELCDLFNIDFTQYMSQPPEPSLPRTPDEEWSLVLQGEEVHVNPNDDDATHIADHEKRVQAMMMGPQEDMDMDAVLMMRDHIMEHQQQLMQKQQAQEVMQGLQGLVGAAKNAMQGTGPAQQPQPQQGQPGQNPIAGILGAIMQGAQGQAQPPAGADMGGMAQ